MTDVDLDRKIAAMEKILLIQKEDVSNSEKYLAKLKALKKLKNKDI